MLDTATTTDELVMAWGRGWAVSRRTPAPVPVPGGFRVDVGLPGHRVRHVLHSWDAASLGRLGRALTVPGSWIKAAGDPAAFHAALPPRWRSDLPGHLMTHTPRPGMIPPPAPYRLEITTTGGLTVATVVDPTGATAAAGQLGLAGGHGVMDQVSTDPAHRRRGLGTVVMAALNDHAARHRVHTGILVATDDGRALYKRLGWAVRSPIAVAYLPEDEPTA